MSYYHLRFSVSSKDNALPVVSRFKAVFPISSLAVGYETVDDNLHIHCHIVYKDGFNPDENKVKTKRSALTKKLKNEGLIPDIPNASYHEAGKKTDLKNLAYCLKDRDILLLENIDENLVKEALKESDRIEEEKTTKMKDQLLADWQWRDRLFSDKLEAFMFIDEYHIARDYLPPNMTLKLQYALYIIYKTKTHETLEKYQLLASMYSVKEEYVGNIFANHKSYKERDNDLKNAISDDDLRIDPNEVNFMD